MVPVRWYGGRFTLDGRVLRLPVAKGCPPLMVRLDRDVPYPAGQVRSVTLLFDGRRLQVDVTAEVPVACYPDGRAPDPERVAGIDLGIIHPYAVAGPDGHGLLVSGRAVRAECRLHLRDSKARTRAAARRAPKPGQRGSRRWRQHRRSQRAAEARHGRRVRQAQHEAAGIAVKVTDERGTSSTCPSCSRRVPKPAGRVFRCPHCGHGGHRDLVAAANIAARGGGPIPATHRAGITHRRAGRHLPGAGLSRRDPRRRPPAPTGPLAGTGPPRTPPGERGVARPTREEHARTPTPTNLRAGALRRPQALATPAWIRP
jgi:transposase